MANQHPMLSSVISRLRPSPVRLAAVAALYDPRPLLELQAVTPPCQPR